MWGTIAGYLDKVAGRPPTSVWLWDRRASTLTLFFTRLFIAARWFSPLQHVKALYRIRIQRKIDASTNEAIRIHNKSRQNFEASYTEYYFLAMLCLLLVFQAINQFVVGSPVSHWSIQLISLVLFAESFFWLSYYLLWRNFSEPSYTLYHPAEYFVLFPIVILVNIASYSSGFSVDPVKTLAMFTGAGKDKAALVSVLNSYFFVIILANLLSMFPRTTFKQPVVINIVGAGDVVRNKIIPALLKDGTRLTAQHIAVHTLKGAGTEPEAGDVMGCKVLVAEKEAEIVKKISESGTPAIIATPSEHHFTYISALKRAGVRFAVEKPLSLLPAEIDAILSELESFSPCMFALSYYGLEKALPLSYLLAPNYHFETFLEISGDSITGSDRAMLRFDASAYAECLGRLKSVRIDLLEGADRSPRAGQRAWTETTGTRGLAFETMIHPLVLLSKFLRQQKLSMQDFRPDTITGTSAIAVNPKSATFLLYTGQIPHGDGAIAIELACGKYIPKQDLKRSGIATFENGTLAFDFDQQTCAIVLNTGEKAKIGVCARFVGKYDVQTNLVRKFFQEGFYDVRYDDLTDQVEALRWLRHHRAEVIGQFSY